MAKQTINIGTSANSRDGDPLRNAFTKINENFDELYTGNFVEPDAITSSLAPDTDGTYDLGKIDKRWADLYVKDFIYLNGQRIEISANGTLLINGGPPAERQDTLGSVFADDSTVMVDGIAGKIVGPVDTTTVDADTITATNITGALTGNVTGDLVGSVFADDSTTMIDGVGKFVNLDGTVKGNIIPDTDIAYDIGSMTHRFRDLYLSGSTINLGGLEITNDNGVITFGGEKVVVEGGSGDVKGSVFGDDSTLLVDAKANVESSTDWDTAFAWGDHAAAGYLVQADILDGTLTIDVNNTGDLQGSVFGDDSTLLVDAINSVVPKAVVEDSANWDTAFSWGDHNAAGYQSATAPFTGDVKGSVFADDSTLIIDGTNGNITAQEAIFQQQAIFKDGIIIQNGSDLVTIGDAAGASFQLPNKGVAFLGGGVDGGTYNIAFTANGNGSILVSEQLNILSGAGMAIGTVDGLTINSTVTVDAAVTAPSFVGDVTGSVFADDSTLLVDGVNGSIPYSVISDIQVTESDLLVDWASIVGTQIQTNGLPINTFTNGDLELGGTLTFADTTVQSTAYIERFVNRSLFTSNQTITDSSANLLQFDASQGSVAFNPATYQWTPATTGLYRIDFVLGLTQSEVNMPLTVFLYNITAASNQITLFNGTFSGSVLSMSGTVYLMAGQNFQFGIIQQTGDSIILDRQLTSAGIEELTRE